MAPVAVTTATPILGVTSVTAEKAGEAIIRYGLVLVITWFAIMKFTTVEAEGLKPLVAGSPLLGWTYRFLSVDSFSMALGVVELAIACLIVCGLSPSERVRSAVPGPLVCS